MTYVSSFINCTACSLENCF